MKPHFARNRSLDVGKLAQSLRSFTLIELLVVICIIAILAGLTIGVAGFVQKKAGKSRAQGEIAAMETALERYKQDNGIYPTTNATLMRTNDANYKTANPVTVGGYINGATILYSSLSGKVSTNAPLTTTMYMEFNKNQVGGTNFGYVQDPFGNPYGYSTTYEINNAGFFDLWSTCATTNNLQWVSNWKQN